MTLGAGEGVKMIGLLCTLLAVAMVFIAPIIATAVLVPPSNCSTGRTTLDSALHTVYEKRSDVTVVLEAGEHCINDFDLILTELYNVTIKGEGNVTIRCAPRRGLAVFNATGLTISNVVFDQCGITNDHIFDFLALVNETIDFFFTISNDSRNNITLLCGHCVDFQLTNVTVKNTLGLGFLGINLIGDSVLRNVTFSHNVPSGCYFLSPKLLETEKIGGGALLIYSDYLDLNFLDLMNTTKLSIMDAHFLYNSYCSKLYLTQFLTDYVNNELESYYLNGGGGLSLKLAQLGYKVNFTVIDSVFKNNTARAGGGANVQVYTGVYNSSIEFSDCLFSKNGLKGDIVFNYDYLTYGSGLIMVTDSFNPRIGAVNCLISDNVVPTTVKFSNTDFSDNRAFSAAAASIFSLYSPGQRRQFPHYIVFDSCTFRRNLAFSASAVLVQEWKYIAAQPGLNVILKDVDVIENTNFEIQEISSELVSSGVIFVLATNLSIVGESVVRDNTGSGVYLERAILHVDGNLSIINNSASLGAGIRVETQSLIIVNNNTKLNLIENRASVYGGGIYSNIIPPSGQARVPDCSIYFGELNLLCFQDFAEKCANVSNFKVDIMFKGNSAQLGSMVYGTTLDTCPWAETLKNNYTRDDNIFDLLYDLQLAGLRTPMHFDVSPNNSKELATAAFVLKVVNDSIAAIPGQSVTVHAEALDKFFRPALSVITSYIDGFSRQINHKKNYSSIGHSNYWLLEANASSSTLNIPLKVYNSPSSHRFNVTLVALGSYAQDNVLVHVVDCPVGFVLDEESLSCICDIRLQGIGPAPILCNDDNSLSVPPDLWIGFAQGDNTTLIFTTCHFDFCVTIDKNVSNGNFSSQCKQGYNRDGVGCGGCMEGYGLVLGSNRCQKCSNINLLYILVFALIGIAIIFLMSLLHVSISNGYLNGILFYATIITLFSSVLSSEARSIAFQLQLFSWLNLDLDNELCFYSDMTVLQRAALRFVFPLYLYSLMGIIILISKVSQRFANVFNRRGYSATKLFATLFVMTYTNILRTCMEILGADFVSDLDGNVYSVWISDSNVPYFQGEHIPLLLLAITILVVYLIPAPFILLFPGLTLRLPILKKYKPLYDAFWAPFKPNFRFWIGLRLLLRIIPLVLAYFVQTPLNVHLLTVFLIILTYAEAVLQPFEGKARNASDLFFLFNLVCLLTGYLYFYVYQFNSRDLSDNALDSVQTSQMIFFSVNIGIVISLLIVLIIVRIFVRYPILQYWGWKLLTKVCFCKVCTKWIPERPDAKLLAKKRNTITEVTSERASTNLETSIESSGQQKRTVATFSELRESLLDSYGSVEVQQRGTVN